MCRNLFILTLLAATASGCTPPDEQFATVELAQLEEPAGENDCDLGETTASVLLDTAPGLHHLDANRPLALLVTNNRRVPALGKLTVIALTQHGERSLEHTLELTGSHEETIAVPATVFDLDHRSPLDISGEFAFQLTVLFEDDQQGTSPTLRRSFYPTEDSIQLYDREQESEAPRQGLLSETSRVWAADPDLAGHTLVPARATLYSSRSV
jgi:hypothetical protein